MKFGECQSDSVQQIQKPRMILSRECITAYQTTTGARETA